MRMEDVGFMGFDRFGRISGWKPVRARQEVMRGLAKRSGLVGLGKAGELGL
jgi:hypothetical protein